MNEADRVPEPARVAIAKVDDVDDLERVRLGLREALRLLGERVVIPRGGVVLVKVNLCALCGPETGVSVDPRLARLLSEWLVEAHDVREVIVGEADATYLDADEAFHVLGWHDVFRGVPRVRLINLSRDERVSVDLSGLYFQELKMPRSLMEADYLISFAKLKTHSVEGMTCVMKNQFGALPEANKLAYHAHLPEAICDAAAVRMPDLCLVDGMIAQEGDGPVYGVPRLMGIIVAGTDAIATDQVCARVIGRTPRRVPHLRLAEDRHLGCSSWEVCGVPIADVARRVDGPNPWQPRWHTLRGRLAGAR